MSFGPTTAAQELERAQLDIQVHTEMIERFVADNLVQLCKDLVAFSRMDVDENSALSQLAGMYKMMTGNPMLYATNHVRQAAVDFVVESNP